MHCIIICCVRMCGGYCVDGEVDLSSVDIHAVASALKLYLRELPIPLVTYEAYDLCVIATSELL